MTESTHFIGIGGTGMSAIARVLLERGQTVTGSDEEMSPQAEALRQSGVNVFLGHQAKQINGAQLVIRSSAVPDENLEVVRAREKGIPVLKRSEALGKILEDQRVLAIAGSHGKTTTTAMIAWILTELGQEPGFIVGSPIKNLSTNASAGNGQLFVIEADEYDHMFLGLSPSISIVTNVEHDHPDIFPTEQSFFQSFRDFSDRLAKDGDFLYCSDNLGASDIAKYARGNSHNVHSYSISNSSADYQGLDLKSRKGVGYAFDFSSPRGSLISVELGVPGRHNVENAVAALALIHLLGLPLKEAASALSSFQGTDRRFEIAGEANGVLFVDDYAHHPTEITASLSAARDLYPERRLIALWQPHTYSRTQLLWEEFIQSLKEADRAIVVPVFAAREEAPADFDLMKKIELMNSQKLFFMSSLSAAAENLESILIPNDLLIVLSAGDALSLNQELLSRLGNSK